jgi:hypothetical protein
MSVYVDDAFAQGEWGRWTGGGHMQGDTLDELHAMAARLGLERSWFQSKPGRPWHDHYDLTRRGRELAIELGALPIGWRDAARRNRAARRAHRQAAAAAESGAAAD